MIILHVDKILVERFVQAITTGESIKMPPGQWNNDELLVLAACCIAVLTQQNSDLQPPLDAQRQQQLMETDSINEHRLDRDLVAALGAIRELANYAIDDYWDQQFADAVEVVVDESQYRGAGVRNHGGIVGGINYPEQ